MQEIGMEMEQDGKGWQWNGMQRNGYGDKTEMR